MIRGVTIDFWNTLVDAGNGELRQAHRAAAMREAFESVGAVYDAAAVERASRASYRRFEEQWFGVQRTMTASETLGFMWTDLGITVSPEMHAHVTRAYEESILIGTPRLLDGAAETVAALAARFSIALISDTAISPGTMLRMVLERHGIAHHFTTMVFSDETGVAKPHPKAFATALHAIGTQPHETVHIGDIERTDIAGAKAAGMHAILFEGDTGGGYMNDPSGATAADARASRWGDIPGIIDTLDGKEGKEA